MKALQWQSCHLKTIEPFESLKNFDYNSKHPHMEFEKISEISDIMKSLNSTDFFKIQMGYANAD